MASSGSVRFGRPELKVWSSRRDIRSAGGRPLSTVTLGLGAATLLLVTGTRPPAFAQATPPQHPSFLILVADDLSWRDLGVYGNKTIRTPHLDRLARSGLQVRYAFGTSPQCSPSRISTLSGKYSHATRTEDLHMPLPEGERILPSHLQSQGYFTGMMAKTHIGRAGDQQFQWYSPKLSEAFPSFLDSAGTRPFLLWVGFHDPHRPYQPGTLPEPHSPGRVSVPPYLVDEPETRADLAL
jgi:N-sulfoglucosamine sulfohydrolase